LDNEGIWISEFSYFPLLLKNLTYDQICHEHVTYYSLNTFKKIIDKQGFKLIDISFNEINGGSIEVVCAKKKSSIKPNLVKIASTLKEENDKINFQSFQNLQYRVDNTKRVLNLLLSNIKKTDIIGYGASTKGNIVLNQCGISAKDISYICDENPYKFGRFTPGSNIKIISKKEMRKIKPKYLLVLIWSFRKEVIIQEKEYLESGGKMIFHLPSLHIIDKENYRDFLNKDFGTFSFDY
jgi:NDP-4-keto-2,6-dideoxyhexose 3-C-methyltransferase